MPRYTSNLVRPIALDRSHTNTSQMREQNHTVRDARSSLVSQQEMTNAANHSVQIQRLKTMQYMVDDNSHQHLKTPLSSPYQRQVIQLGGGFSCMGGGSGKKKKNQVVPSDNDELGDLDLKGLNFEEYAEQKKGNAFESLGLLAKPEGKFQIEGQHAAKSYIDSISDLGSLRQETVSETALDKTVQQHLALAMKAFGEEQQYPNMFDDLADTALLGINGNCMLVAPIFAYLLNSIFKEQVTRVHRPGGLGGPHTMLETTNSENRYIDPTWRQGNNPDPYSMGGINRNDPRKALPMVRISEEEPTMEKVDEAVKNAMGNL